MDSPSPSHQHPSTRQTKCGYTLQAACKGSSVVSTDAVQLLSQQYFFTSTKLAMLGTEAEILTQVHSTPQNILCTPMPSGRQIVWCSFTANFPASTNTSQSTNLLGCQSTHDSAHLQLHLLVCVDADYSIG